MPRSKVAAALPVHGLLFVELLNRNWPTLLPNERVPLKPVRSLLKTNMRVGLLLVTVHRPAATAIEPMEMLVLMPCKVLRRWRHSATLVMELVSGTALVN